MTNDICNKCIELKKEHQKLVPSIMEEDISKAGEVKAKQLELKKDYVKMQQEAYLIADLRVANSIHYCYTECKQNIRR